MINTEKQKTKNNNKQSKNGVGDHITQWGPPEYNQLVVCWGIISGVAGMWGQKTNI